MEVQRILDQFQVDLRNELDKQMTTLKQRLQHENGPSRIQLIKAIQEEAAGIFSWHESLGDVAPSSRLQTLRAELEELEREPDRNQDVISSVNVGGASSSSGPAQRQVPVVSMTGAAFNCISSYLEVSNVVGEPESSGPEGRLVPRVSNVVGESESPGPEGQLVPPLPGMNVGGSQVTSAKGSQAIENLRLLTLQINCKVASVFQILLGQPSNNLGFGKVVNPINPYTELDQLSSLPRSIMVRTWEQNGSIFEALVLGPENSPYRGALFVFHIMIPYLGRVPVVKYAYPHINIGRRVMNTDGYLNPPFVEEMWKNKKSIAGMLLELRNRPDFFEEEVSGMGKTTVVVSTFYEIWRSPSASFQREIKDHMIALTPFITKCINEVKGDKSMRRGMKRGLLRHLDLLQRALLVYKGNE